MNFTFKTEQPTGAYRSFYEPEHLIKLNKVRIGNITPKLFIIRLMVVRPNKNPNCSWEWIQLKKKSETLEEAKAFLKDNYELLTKMYEFPKK